MADRIDLGKLQCDLLSCVAVAPIDQAVCDALSNQIGHLVEVVRAVHEVEDARIAAVRNPVFGVPRVRAANERIADAAERFRPVPKPLEAT